MSRTAQITIPGVVSEVTPEKLASAFVVLVAGTLSDGVTPVPPASVSTPSAFAPVGEAVPLVVTVPDLVDGANYSATYHPVGADGNPIGDPVAFSFVASLATVAGVVASGAPLVVIS